MLDEPGGRVAFQFQARDVNLVMGPARRGGPCRSGSSSTERPWTAPPGPTSRPTAAGPLAEQRLYQLIRQAGPIVERRFEIEFLEAGAEAYCFTFG